MDAGLHHALPPLVDGRDFEIDIGAVGAPWSASNGRIAVTVYPSDDNVGPSRRLADGRPALVYKANHVHGIGAAAPWREQICVAELNGVFVHLMERDGLVSVTVADHRLD